MPKPYTRSVAVPWTNDEVGINGTSGCYWKRHEAREGSARLHTDPDPTMARAYTSTIHTGRVITRASPPIDTYYPDPTDGLVPRFGNWDRPNYTRVRNKSWAKLIEDVRGDSSQLGATVAEGREAFEMMARRATGIWRSYRNLRRGDFKGFLRELSVSPKRKHRNIIRTASHEASGLWLEYWFGWAPLAGDLFTSAVVLGSPPPAVWYTCVGKATERLPPVSRNLGSGGYYYRRLTTLGTKISMRQGGQFRISNPNLFLANRLGLVNPLAIAWELVPFSFVVDWFVKFGNVLEGFTDLYGTEQANTYSTRYLRSAIRGEYGYARCVVGFRSCRVERQLGLSRPIPVVPRLANFGKSRTRAATAVSLMVQLFVSQR